MRTARRKKQNTKEPYYIVNTILTKQRCLNCGKKKELHFYEVKNILWGKTEFKVMMCKDCLEELKFKLLESPSDDKKMYSENMIQIINTMLKENDCVSKES